MKLLLRGNGRSSVRHSETALLTVTESLSVAGALSHPVVLILLDLSSAFDTVNHQILLSTQAELGIAVSALTWFTSYLTNRTCQVTRNGSLSNYTPYTRSLGSAITSHRFSYHC